MNVLINLFLSELYIYIHLYCDLSYTNWDGAGLADELSSCRIWKMSPHTELHSLYYNKMSVSIDRKSMADLC